MYLKDKVTEKDGERSIFCQLIYTPNVHQQLGLGQLEARNPI